jgi:hypothetical protein
MKIQRSTLFCLMREGRITLQIPQYALEIGEHDNNDGAFIECEEDWFMLANTEDGRPSIGNESGFTFLTKKGWNALKTEIDKEFIPRGRTPGTLKDLYEHAESVFKKREIASEKYCKNLEKKMQQMKEMIKKKVS